MARPAPVQPSRTCLRRQWNLDIIGVAGIEAEAELLAALVTFFKAAGLGPQDVGIKVDTC